MLPAGFYFRSFNGKRNFAPPAAESDWFKLESILLANGDDVGVVTMWTYPADRSQIAPDVLALIFGDIDRRMPDGQRYSSHNAAKKRAAWRVVKKHCPDKTQDQCRAAITAWVKRGLLYEDEYRDEARRENQSGLFVRKPATAAAA
jgi:hypothetical protein